MKIISWNVNGIRAVERKNELFPFLKTHDPDVFLMQEIKGSPDQFSPELRFHPHYAQYYFPAEKAGYSGTGIWVKKQDSIEIIEFMTGMPDYNDDEGRVSRVDIRWNNSTYAILGVYFPNGGKSEAAWDDKLVFYEKFLAYVNSIREQNIHCIWGGDVNCAHNEIDIARPEENDGKIGFHPLERAWISKCINHRWKDVFRENNPYTRDIYSWWHLVTRARERNVGWRIDYFFCDQNDIEDIDHIEYLMNQMGSDHCPVLLRLKA